jgi:hypothetical protein
LQEAARGRTRDPHDRAIGKKRCLALTHFGLPLASSSRLI